FVYVYTNEEIAEQAKRNRKSVNQIFHLKYMNARDVAVLIKPYLSSTGQIAMTPAALSGLASGATDTGGDNNPGGDILVINDFVENIADVTMALKDIDARPKQVLIEATILNAALKDNNALGIDMVSLSGLNFTDI